MNNVKKDIYEHPRVQNELVKSNNGGHIKEEDILIIFSGKELKDADDTLSDIGIKEHATLQLLLRLRGGGKKGLKKLSKDEKTHTLRARVHYMSQSLSQQNSAVINKITTDPNFFDTAVKNLTHDQLKEFNHAIQHSTRNEQILKVMPKFLVPQLDVLKKQQEEIAATIKAIEVAVESAYTEQYYESTGYESEPFIQMVSDRASAMDKATERANLQILFDEQVIVQARRLFEEQSASAMKD
jgi:hypothetical protein